MMNLNRFMSAAAVVTALLAPVVVHAATLQDAGLSAVDAQ